MAENLAFKDWQCHDDRPAICREAAIKRTLSFAGIHDTNTESVIDETFGGDLSNWEGAEATWEIDTGALKATGGGSAQWYKTRHVTEVELGFVITFDKTGDRGMFIFCSDDSYNAYYFVWTGTTIIMGGMVAGVMTDHVLLPCAEAGASTVTVMVWPQSYTSVDEVDDLVCSLWFDDRLLLTHTVAYDDTKGNKIGFGVYQSDVITYDNIHVPQFHQIAPWTSVDPGEAASAGLSRTIAYARIRVQARYDGTLKIWRNDTVDSDWTVQAWRPLKSVESKQIFWPNHLRLVGALHESDVFREDSQGHIFAMGQDPNVLSEESTNTVAVLSHRGIEEQGHMLELTMAPNPIIEPEDVLTYNSNTWRVTSIGYRVILKGEEGQSGTPILESSMQLRECIAEGEGEA